MTEQMILAAIALEAARTGKDCSNVTRWHAGNNRLYGTLSGGKTTYISTANRLLLSLGYPTLQIPGYELVDGKLFRIDGQNSFVCSPDAARKNAA